MYHKYYIKFNNLKVEKITFFAMETIEWLLMLNIRLPQVFTVTTQLNSTILTLFLNIIQEFTEWNYIVYPEKQL